MGRLIDADALIEEVYKRFDNLCVLSKMEYVIGEQPTAYDVEKVVKELEEESRIYLDGQGYMTWTSEAIPKSIAIPIVQMGGVDDRERRY